MFEVRVLAKRGVFYPLNFHSDVKSIIFCPSVSRRDWERSPPFSLEVKSLSPFFRLPRAEIVTPPLSPRHMDRLACYEQAPFGYLLWL